MSEQPIAFWYRNHRGVVEKRHVIPDRVWFGKGAYYDTPRWLLRAHAIDRGMALRDFDLEQMLFRDLLPIGAIESYDIGQPREMTDAYAIRRLKASIGRIAIEHATVTSGLTDDRRILYRADLVMQPTAWMPGGQGVDVVENIPIRRLGE